MSLKIRSRNKTLRSVSLRFKPASQCLLFFKMNSRQEYRSKLSFTTKRITKTAERFLSLSRGQKMSKDFLSSVLGQIPVSNLTNACA